MKATSDGGFFFACASDGAFTVGCGSVAWTPLAAVAARFHRWLWKFRLDTASCAGGALSPLAVEVSAEHGYPAIAVRFHPWLLNFQRGRIDPSILRQTIKKATVSGGSIIAARRSANQAITAAYPPPLPRHAAWAPVCRARR